MISSRGISWVEIVFPEDSGKLINMYEAGVIEPLLVKEHAIKSAVDAAIMILRIDDVIAASKIRGEKSFSGGESE